jgi:hypothetical protein
MPFLKMFFDYTESNSTLYDSRYCLHCSVDVDVDVDVEVDVPFVDLFIINSLYKQILPYSPSFIVSIPRQ